jgi:hypothetical protein
VKREGKAVTQNLPAHPAEQSGEGVGNRTPGGIVVRYNKPPELIGLVQKDMETGEEILLSGQTLTACSGLHPLPSPGEP